MVIDADRQGLDKAATDARKLVSRRDVIRHAPAISLMAFPSLACAQSEMTVNLFTQIAKLKISNSLQTILTRGWQRPGIGAARYVYDQRVDRTWVSSHPRSSAISANGRGFRLESIGGDVRQYGALGDGKADDTAAINEALSTGGEVRLTGPATYYVTDRLIISVARTRLLLGRSVTLVTTAWRYKGAQAPFGNAIHVTADDCEVIGEGPTSIIENVRSDANGIGFLHCGGGRIARLLLKGGKASLAAIKDDTFQSGISVVNDRSNNPSGRTSGTIIEDCSLVDWMQYGINIYGDLATDIAIRRNSITRTGQASDAESVGAGVALTRGVGPIRLESNVITDNKGCGIFISSAGRDIREIEISHNQIRRNGREGIVCSEAKNFSSADDAGQKGVTISDNVIDENGVAGIRGGTYDGVGRITDMTILRNRIARNRGPGILLQANPEVGRGLSALVANNELVANEDYGLAIGLNRISLRHSGNRFERNARGASIDHRGGTARPLAD